MKFVWACPRCGADANKHGKGRCSDRLITNVCQGFLCECDEDTGADHGETLQDPCSSATCHHCGWTGTFPMKPKGLQTWEKKALEAGWTMPEARKKELGL